jgi:hypothetical protein
MARTAFTDITKAKIYERDLATCSFSGQSLWLLDSGAAGLYMPDWADHIVPAARGGPSTEENGVCASWLYNYNKGTNVGANIYLFFGGLPTADFFLVHDVVPEELSERWQRFAQLHYSDWFFNRAIWRLALGLRWLNDPKSLSGTDRKRDNVYYAKASLNIINVWQKITKQDNVPTLEKRGLIPRPLFDDQKQLLRIREASSYEFILDVMQRLLPYHSANVAAFDRFLNFYNEAIATGYSTKSVNAFLRSIKQDKFVTPIVKSRIRTNIKRLLLGS